MLYVHEETKATTIGPLIRGVHQLHAVHIFMPIYRDSNSRQPKVPNCQKFQSIENKFDTVCLSYYRQLGYSIPQSIIDEAPTSSLKEEYRKYNNDTLETSIDPTFMENFQATHHYEYHSTPLTPK